MTLAESEPVAKSRLEFLPLGIACASFIPVIGVLFGVVAITWGVLRRITLLIVLGLLGIAVTGVTGGFFWWESTSRVTPSSSTPLLDLDKRVSPVPTKARAVAETIQTEKVPAPKFVASETHAAPKTVDLAARWLAAANDSGFVKARVAQRTEMTMESFAKFFAQIGLTPAQIDQLAVLLTEKGLSATNVAIAQLQKGILPDPYSDAFLSDLMDERVKADQEIKSFLGDANFQELENYLRARAEDAVSIRLGRVIGQTPDALTEPQAAQLKQLLEQTPDGNLSPDIISSANRFLSAAQVRALEDAYATQQAIFRRRNRDALPPLPAKTP